MEIRERIATLPDVDVSLANDDFLDGCRGKIKNFGKLKGCGAPPDAHNVLLWEGQSFEEVYDALAFLYLEGYKNEYTVYVVHTYGMLP
jgi:hypothetical protein